jgi:hypothetical protein
MVEPIDLCRWSLAVRDIEHELDRVTAPGCKPDHQSWEWLRIHYACSLASFNTMSAEQQSSVLSRLNEVRKRLLSLVSEANDTAPSA